MEKIIETTVIEIDRYSVIKSESTWAFTNDMGIDYHEGEKDTSYPRIYYNTAVRRTDYLDTIFAGENSNYRHTFNSRTDCIEVMKKHGYKKFAAISLYQENGYVGVALMTDEKAFVRVPNNWVRNGADQNLGIVFYNEDEEIKNLSEQISQYVNYGFEIIEIYDEKEEEHIESFIYLGSNYKEYQEWKQQMIEKYEFESDKDF